MAKIDSSWRYELEKFYAPKEQKIRFRKRKTDAEKIAEKDEADRRGELMRKRLRY